jgi:hypothetical protein
LADRRGWATFIGTPKGKNEFFRLYQEAQKDPNWFHLILKASESGIISAAGLTDLQREMGEDQYQHGRRPREGTNSLTTPHKRPHERGRASCMRDMAVRRS